MRIREGVFRNLHFNDKRESPFLDLIVPISLPMGREGPLFVLYVPSVVLIQMVYNQFSSK